MSSGIEARYLIIEWLAEGVARTIEAAPVPLEVEPRADGSFVVEAAIFNDFHPWFGIRLAQKFQGAVPTLITASGREAPLLPVTDPIDGTTWWLQNDGWDANGKQHLSELRRSAGTYSIRVKDVTLQIENRLSRFGRAEIQSYVDDFRGDLLWMIMSDEVGATANGSGVSSGAELAGALEELRLASQKVLASPAVIIRERQTMQASAKVRASHATFRQYVRNPVARQMIGRAFDESADTPDNRYLRHMLSVATKVADAYMAAASLQTSFLEGLAYQEGERARQNREVHVRRVDPEVFDQQTGEIRRKLDALACFRDVSEPGPYGRFPIRLGNRYYDDFSFYYSRQDDDSGHIDSDVDYRVVVLPERMFELVVGAHHICRELTIEGVAISRRVETKSGKTFRQIRFASVHEVRPNADVLEKREEKRRRLEGNSWIVRISENERRELLREALAAERRAERALGMQNDTSRSIELVRRASCVLAQVDAALAGAGISCSSSFPMGMRYVSNPNYAACTSAFNKVRELFERSGVDLSRLEEIRTIGILHASDIYEKWCMLQILLLLVHDFGFEPEPGWKGGLVSASLSRVSNVKFRLHRQDLAMKVVLTCQAETASGRRPDFVLEIYGEAEEEPSDRDKRQRCGIVMDAKFRSEWNSHGPRHVLDELLLAKDYRSALDGGKVFILQPCEATVRPATSPLEWGRHCDYGSTQSHRQGWVQAGVAPSGARSTQHLKRLLAMAFQEAFPEPQEEEDEGGNLAWVSRSFCIGCGERHLPAAIQSKNTTSGRISWLLDCRSCGVWTVRTHCYSCKKPLFKNGTVWTYHGTVADQVTNVICPGCGSYFDVDFG